jgi:lipopolysaccharide transport system permease protein
MQAVSPPKKPQSPAKSDLHVEEPKNTAPQKTDLGFEIPEFEIRPQRGWVAIDFKEVFHYRELLYFLTWRDVKIRYKQTVLGFAWAIIQPVINVVIQTLIFGFLFGMKDRLPPELRATPYPLFNYCGVLAWMLFSTGVQSGGTSLISQQNLLTKVYFPRLFVPASVIGAAFVDAMVSLGVLFVMMACYGAMPPVWIVFLPFMLLLTVIAATGMACLLSALTVTYRDFRFLIPFMVSTWGMISPVGYPLDVTYAKHPIIYWLLRMNPMYDIINGYRACLLRQHWDVPGMAIATVETIGILLLGMYYFKKTERRFADIA